MPAKRPNILVILSDQQRYDTVGAYGQPLGTQLNLTPHLDAMAAEGTLFRRTFTCQPVCGPARACLQTGRYCTETGCVTNNCPLPLDEPTIAKALTSAGYETGYIGKWHLASGNGHNMRTKAIPKPYRGGYEHHWLAADTLEFTSHGYEGYMYDGDNRRVDFEGYRVDCCANFVMDYLTDYASRRPDRPFFLFSSFIEPHHQNDLDRYIGPIGSKQRFAKYPVPGDLIGTEPREGARCDWPLHMPDYLGCCWSLDQNLGRIREYLKLLGLDEDTVVIYTSDHGCHFCTRNGEYKRSCHEASIRIPLIATGPGFTGGNTVEEMTSLIDVPSTVVSCAGLEPTDAMRGRALDRIVAGKAGAPREHIFLQISESQTGRAIRTDRWKYCIDSPWHDENITHGTDYFEQYLYDLQADPFERNNLAADANHRDTRAQLAAIIGQQMVQIGEPEPRIHPAKAN